MERFLLILPAMLLIYNFYPQQEIEAKPYKCDQHGDCYCDLKEGLYIMDGSSRKQECLSKKYIEKEYRCNLKENDFVFNHETNKRTCIPKSAKPIAPEEER